jgi:hypothetical protein
MRWSPACKHVSLEAEERQLLEPVFSMRSVPRLYNEDQLPIRVSPETAARRVGGWCKIASSPKAEEHPLLEAATKQLSEDCE